MTGALDKLVDLLAEETAELQRLLPLLEDQHHALLRGDAAGVADVTSRQEPVAARLIRLESGRRPLVEQVAADLRVRPADLTLSSLARLPNPPARLGEVRRELRTVATRLATLSRQNAFLLARSVEFVEGLLGQILSALDPAPTYGRGARQTGGLTAAGLVDRQA
jgi:flagellar biosynthesis/type III secretory pathway chaperone